MHNKAIQRSYGLTDNEFQTMRRVLSGLIPVSPEMSVEMTSAFSRRQFKKHETLLTVGEMWDKVYFITEGLLRIFYITEDGREFNKDFYHEGQFLFPMIPLATREPSRFTIATIEPVTALCADYTAFRAILSKGGQWDAFALAHAEKLAEQKVVREAEFLLDPAMVRLQNFERQFKAYLHRIQDYHIASYLGITNVTLSRLKRASSDLA